MTIGERITEIRKGAHLSQESFGETLGVTRQAISKWESDASIPDVDKLILISKTYNVPVGWILGIEEKNSTDEFSESQLELVREIVKQCSKEYEKHTVSTDPPQPQKRKGHKFLTFLLIVAVFSFAIWCGNLSDRLLSLENSQGYLRSQITSVENTVANQTNILTGQIEEILNAQNSVLADFGYTIVGYDYSADTVDIEVYIVPKTYTDGMTVEFAATSEDISFTADGVEGENHRFKGTITCKMSDCINLTAAITKGEVVETQLIDVVYDTRIMTIPTLYFSSVLHLWGSVDVTTASAIEEEIIICEDGFSNAFQNNITVSAVEVFVIINGEVYDKLVCQKNSDQYDILWSCPYDFKYPLKNGDTVQYVAVATDNYGRQHLVYDSRYIVENNFVDYDVSYKFDEHGEDIYGLLDQ